MSNVTKMLLKLVGNIFFFEIKRHFKIVTQKI